MAPIFFRGNQAPVGTSRDYGNLEEDKKTPLGNHTKSMAHTTVVLQDADGYTGYF